MESPERINALRAQRMTWAQVAAELGVTQETLRVWRHALKMPMQADKRVVIKPTITPRQRLIEDEFREPIRRTIMGMRRMNYSWATIAGALAISMRQLCVWRKQLGLPINQFDKRCDEDWEELI